MDYEEDYEYEELELKNDHAESYKKHIKRLLEKYSE